MDCSCGDPIYSALQGTSSDGHRTITIDNRTALVEAIALSPSRILWCAKGHTSQTFVLHCQRILKHIKMAKKQVRLTVRLASKVYR